MTDVVEETKNELRRIVESKYNNKPEVFKRVCNDIIETFGFVYPGDTLQLIDRISSYF